MSSCKTCAFLLKGHNTSRSKVCNELMLHGFVDSGWARDVGDRKSTSDCCFSLGSRVIYWFSRKHALVAFSLVEAEYVVAIIANCEAIWILMLIAEMT